MVFALKQKRCKAQQNGAVLEFAEAGAAIPGFSRQTEVIEQFHYRKKGRYLAMKCMRLDYLISIL